MFTLTSSKAPVHPDVEAQTDALVKSVPLDTYMTRKMLHIFEDLDFFKQIPLEARYKLLEEMKIVQYPPETLSMYPLAETVVFFPPCFTHFPPAVRSRCSLPAG